LGEPVKVRRRTARSSRMSAAAAQMVAERDFTAEGEAVAAEQVEVEEAIREARRLAGEAEALVAEAAEGVVGTTEEKLNSGTLEQGRAARRQWSD
jgi:hypothetical protein